MRAAGTDSLPCVIKRSECQADSRGMELGLFLLLAGVGYGAYELNQWRRDRTEAVIDNLWMLMLGLPLNIVFAACVAGAGIWLIRGAL